MYKPSSQIFVIMATRAGRGSLNEISKLADPEPPQFETPSLIKESPSDLYYVCVMANIARSRGLKTFSGK